MSAAPSIASAAQPYDAAGLSERILRAAGAVKTGTLALVVTTTMASQTITMRYQGSYDVTDPDSALCRVDGTQNGQMLTMIVVGDNLYTKVGTAKYSKSSVPSSVAKLGLASIRPDLPTLVGLVGASTRSLTYIGPDTVAADPVQRWRALVDASGFAPGATGTASVELWIDADYLVHQISYSLTSTGVAAATSVATVTYADVNQPVDISEPSSSEVR
ncbi:MAG: hypothetical protein ACOH16_01515 [Propionibacteriaceae bacterium]